MPKPPGPSIILTHYHHHRYFLKEKGKIIIIISLKEKKLNDEIEACYELYQLHLKPDRRWWLVTDSVGHGLPNPTPTN